MYIFSNSGKITVKNLQTWPKLEEFVPRFVLHPKRFHYNWIFLERHIFLDERFAKKPCETCPSGIYVKQKSWVCKKVCSEARFLLYFCIWLWNAVRIIKISFRSSLHSEKNVQIICWAFRKCHDAGTVSPVHRLMPRFQHFSSAPHPETLPHSILHNNIQISCFF